MEDCNTKNKISLNMTTTNPYISCISTKLDIIIPEVLESTHTKNRCISTISKRVQIKVPEEGYSKVVIKDISTAFASDIDSEKNEKYETLTDGLNGVGEGSLHLKTNKG